MGQNLFLSAEDKQRKIEKQFTMLKCKLSDLIQNRRWDAALSLLSVIAKGEYIYNQYYRDDMLEDALQCMAANFLGNMRSKPIDDSPRKADILFYDGFGVDLRGLAYIYLDALCASGYRVVYVAPQSGKEATPNIQSLLQKHGGIIEWYPDVFSRKAFNRLWEICTSYNVKAGFIYTTPWDVVGLMVFEGLKGHLTRYLINLTDHAFWLGVRALDYCLEFRDYGASISCKYRKLEETQLILQPYYPIINKEIEFVGFPFKKEQGDFVIFSGGSLYKTLDKEKTFYHLVNACLDKYPFVKFWYAGNGDGTEIHALIRKYPGRVAWTAERQDLFQLLQHVDLYLNTYPVSGGLMLQYAALAGKIPLTLLHDADAKGFLLHQDSLGIYFDEISSFLEELYHLIENASYRARKEQALAHTVISPEDFRENLWNILEKNQSGFTVNLEDAASQDMQKNYLEMFDEKREIPRLIATRKHLSLAAVVPYLFLKGGMTKILQKIKKF